MEENKPHCSESTTDSLLLIGLSIFRNSTCWEKKEMTAVSDRYFSSEIKRSGSMSVFAEIYIVVLFDGNI